MESPVQPVAQEPSREEVQKVKKDQFTWWQALIILAATLAICLSAGYYISEKYLWNQTSDEITKQLKYYQSQVKAKPNDAELRVQLGYTYYLKGDDSNAIKELKTAKNLDKKSYGAYLNLAIVYDKENKNDDALQMAIKASSLVTQDYKSLLLKGRSYRKLKMYKEASAALEEAARYKPANTDIVYEAALVARDQGKKKDAENLFKEVLSYDPTYKPALKELDKLSKKN
ncbi:tetratricopeptide repeat protein [Neobacillus muris]|uniref:tetratricopeptide repeat protein n=1 Tax=Neobacillus muris TaxID=2941334 RepID=UPI00203F02F2|nr:tetratricopeptide repeat protein [Neobacillus muris]